MFPSKRPPPWRGGSRRPCGLTWEAVAVGAALLHVVAHVDAAVDVVHAVQHLAVNEMETSRTGSEAVRSHQRVVKRWSDGMSADLRLMSCSCDPAGCCCFVTSPPSDGCSLATAAVMSSAQSSLSSREQASKKWSTPFFVSSLNTNWKDKWRGDERAALMANSDQENSSLKQHRASSRRTLNVVE